MEIKILSDNDGCPDERAPDWLATLIRSAIPESPGFAVACLRAADESWNLMRLSHASMRLIGPILPAADYIRDISDAAQVSLDWIVRWADMPPDFRLDNRFVVGWARLARALGISRREAMLRFRLAIAEDVGLGCLTLAAARSSEFGTPDIDAWEDLVDRSISGLGEEILDRIREGERRIVAVYEREVADLWD